VAKIDDTLREILDRLSELQDSLDSSVQVLSNDIITLTRGLSVMSDTQRIHSEMLNEILTACSADPGSGSNLTEVLESLTSAVEQQTETLAGIERHLAGLGSTVESSVVRGVVRVEEMREAVTSGRTDGDGVLLDDDDLV
jgi:ABC-type transporter Mla subunit MlaD